MSRDPGAGYEVGFRKPPKHTRFKRGQSGNPRGSSRRHGAAKSLLRVMRKKVKVTENGQTREISVQEGMVLRLAQKALKGDPAAARQLFELEQGVLTADADGAEAEAQHQKALHEQWGQQVVTLLSLDTLMELSGAATKLVAWRPPKKE